MSNLNALMESKTEKDDQDQSKTKSKIQSLCKKKLYGTIECAHSSVEVRVEVRVILGTVVFYAQL